MLHGEAKKQKAPKHRVFSGVRTFPQSLKSYLSLYKRGPELNKIIIIGKKSAMLSCFSRVQLCATPWTVAHQAPLPMELSRQEYWSGLPLPTPGNLPDPGIEPTPLALAGGFFTTSATRLPKSQSCFEVQLKTLCRKPLQHEPFLHSKFTKHEFLLKLLKHAVTASSMP